MPLTKELTITVSNCIADLKYIKDSLDDMFNIKAGDSGVNLDTKKFILYPILLRKLIMYNTAIPGVITDVITDVLGENKYIVKLYNLLGENAESFPFGSFITLFGHTVYNYKQIADDPGVLGELVDTINVVTIKESDNTQTLLIITLADLSYLLLMSENSKETIKDAVYKNILNFYFNSAPKDINKVHLTELSDLKVGQRVYFQYGKFFASGVLGDYTNVTATATDVLLGKTFVDNTGTLSTGVVTAGGYSTSKNQVIINPGIITGTAPITITVGNLYAGDTINPSTSDKTIPANSYLENAIIIKGDANLRAGNIKNGVTIFGVSGKADIVDLSLVTATTDSVLKGKTFIDSTKNLKEGSILTRSDSDITISSGNVTLATGYYPEGCSKALEEASILVDKNKVSISTGYIFLATTKTVGTPYNQDITPSALAQTIPADSYLENGITIKGDPNLLAENIKDGVTIFGVDGAYLWLLLLIDVSLSDVKEGVSFIKSDGTPSVGQLAKRFASNITYMDKDYAGNVVKSLVLDDGYYLKIKYSFAEILSGSYTPTTSDTEIKANSYVPESYIIKGDSNLKAENIKKGVTIFGILGTMLAGLPLWYLCKAYYNGSSSYFICDALLVLANGLYKQSEDYSLPTFINSNGYILEIGALAVGNIRSPDGVLMYKCPADSDPWDNYNAVWTYAFIGESTSSLLHCVYVDATTGWYGYEYNSATKQPVKDSSSSSLYTMQYFPKKSINIIAPLPKSILISKDFSMSKKLPKVFVHSYGLDSSIDGVYILLKGVVGYSDHGPAVLSDNATFSLYGDNKPNYKLKFSKSYGSILWLLYDADNAYTMYNASSLSSTAIYGGALSFRSDMGGNPIALRVSLGL